MIILILTTKLKLVPSNVIHTRKYKYFNEELNKKGCKGRLTEQLFVTIILKLFDLNLFNM